MKYAASLASFLLLSSPVQAGVDKVRSVGVGPTARPISAS